MPTTTRKEEIIRIYLDLVKKNNDFPTRAEMINAGISRDRWRHHFGSFMNLKDYAKSVDPGAFAGIVDQEVDPSVSAKTLKKKMSHYKRFIITSAIYGDKAHKQFIMNLKAKCDDIGALLLVLPTYKSTSPVATQLSDGLDPILKDEVVVNGDIRLNSNLFISSIKISSSNVNPTTGLSRIGQRNGSFIYASPKQFMVPVAVSNTKMPHVIMTTGACTLPNYKPAQMSRGRGAYIASHDHTIGALYVEIRDENIFHFTQIQAEPNGSFVEFADYYTKKGKSVMNPAYFVIGDLHPDTLDEKAFKAWVDCSIKTGCKKWILHDCFGGASINHHEKDKKTLLAQKAVQGKLRLDKEFQQLGSVMTRIFNSGIEEVVIVKSNHDEFLDRWLESGRFIEDHYNYPIAVKLADAQIEGKDPLRFGLEKFGKMKAEHLSKIKWLVRDQDFKVAKIECGSHGDLGANGSKASVASLENAYGSCVAGHSHSARIIRSVWIVGTTSKLKAGYNIGPSSWLHASVFIYPNGTRQMMIAINGKCRL